MTEPEPTAPAVEDVPADVAADVALSRAVRGHGVLVAVGAGLALLFGLIAAAAVAMAGTRAGDPPIVAGVSALGVGALAGLVAAGLTLVTQLRLLRAEPDLVAAQAAARATGARIGLIQRGLLAALVIVVAAWAFVDVDGLLGALVGAAVAAQAALVLALARSRALAPVRRLRAA